MSIEANVYSLERFSEYCQIYYACMALILN